VGLVLVPTVIPYNQLAVTSTISTRFPLRWLPTVFNPLMP
jgi:hypothetical protein